MREKCLEIITQKRRGVMISVAKVWLPCRRFWIALRKPFTIMTEHMKDVHVAYSPHFKSISILLKEEGAYRAALKASTPLSAGVARRGETCGALTGAVMAVGLVAGTDRLDDAEGYVEAMEAAAKVFDRFKNHYGAVKCFRIQQKLFGRHYDFFNPEDAEAW